MEVYTPHSYSIIETAYFFLDLVLPDIENGFAEGTIFFHVLRLMFLVV